MTKFQLISTAPDATRKTNANPFPVEKQNSLEDREILAAVFAGVMQNQDALHAREGWSKSSTSENGNSLNPRELKDNISQRGAKKKTTTEPIAWTT